jgi:hypothetical protein
VDTALVEGLQVSESCERLLLLQDLLMMVPSLFCSASVGPQLSPVRQCVGSSPSASGRHVSSAINPEIAISRCHH